MVVNLLARFHPCPLQLRESSPGRDLRARRRDRDILTKVGDNPTMVPHPDRSPGGMKVVQIQWDGEVWVIKAKGGEVFRTGGKGSTPAGNFTQGVRVETWLGGGGMQAAKQQQPSPPEPPQLCVDGEAHNFQAAKARNDTTDRGAAVNAKAMGMGGGVSGHSKHDHGDRVVLFCSKCGATKVR